MEPRNTFRLLWRAIFFALPVLTFAAQAEEAVQALSSISPQAEAGPAPESSWRPVITGRLANGVRFAILPRQGSEPGVGLLVRNEGGFIAERRPGERGLAHLIEHLFFVSPTNDAPDDLRHFVRIGLPLTFPAPSAGTTSWRETNYFVSTRTTRTADLDTLLALFREAVSELTFRSDAVDDQRADVMREMAERKLGNDFYASYIAAVAPGSPTDVIDAQNSDDVATASVETIRALYRRLYRPENMMIVIVGNVDPAKMKDLIQQRFGRWEAVGPARVHSPTPVFRSDRITPISFSSLRQGRRTAMMTVVAPTLPAPSTRRRQVDGMLMEMLAIRAVNDRLVNGQPDSPPGKVGSYVENGEQGHRLIMLWDNFAGDQWRPAISALRRTTCDLDTVGFSSGEWSTAKRNLIQDLEQRTRDMAGVANVELAKDLSHALANGRELIPPDELLHRARAWLPTISRQAGTDWWRREWHEGAGHIRVEAPELAQIEDPISAVRATVDEAVVDTSCRARR